MELSNYGLLLISNFCSKPTKIEYLSNHFKKVAFMLYPKCYKHGCNFLKINVYTFSNLDSDRHAILISRYILLIYFYIIHIHSLLMKFYKIKTFKTKEIIWKCKNCKFPVRKWGLKCFLHWKAGAWTYLPHLLCNRLQNLGLGGGA